MPLQAIPASFWRGGTSRGLLLRASTLSAFTPPARSQLILRALGAGDPDGRQIDGLGGGVSSLSKVAVIGLPGEGMEDQTRLGRLPGVGWADEGRRGEVGWDVVYRFGQVGVRERTIDWDATCGNLLAAVGVAAVTMPVLEYSAMFARALKMDKPERGPLMFPVSIMAAATGAVVTVRVPLDPWTLQLYEPAEGEGVRIAGVPGEAAGVEVEIPIEVGEGSEGGLPTSNPTDLVEVDGHTVSVHRHATA